MYAKLQVFTFNGVARMKNQKNSKIAVNPKKNQKLKNLKKVFLDTNSINIYAKLQVSRFISVARIKKLQKLKNSKKRYKMAKN